MFRASPSAVNRPDQEPPPSLLMGLICSAFLLTCFTLLPILVLTATHWLVFFFARSTLYQENWMNPALAIISCVIAGAFIRQHSEDERGGLGIFTLGILALILFAWLTHQDIHAVGGLYSRFLPRFLPVELDTYTFAFPAFGLIGMLFFKYLSLKHYS